MSGDTLDLLRGTLDLLILRALRDEERHGYAVSEWIQRATDGTLLVEEGTLYPALHRLLRRGWVASEWGLSENNRKARYYRLTPEGRRRLAAEAEQWRRYSAAVAKALTAEGGAG